MTVILTNTPRPGERPSQDADRVAPRNVPMPPIAKLAFLTEPSPGVYYLNLRIEGEDFYRLRISYGQLCNIVTDGVVMALRESVAHQIQDRMFHRTTAQASSPIGQDTAE